MLFVREAPAFQAHTNFESFPSVVKNIIALSQERKESFRQKTLPSTRVEVNIIKAYSSKKIVLHVQKIAHVPKKLEFNFFSNIRGYSLVGRGKRVENSIFVSTKSVHLCLFYKYL